MTMNLFRIAGDMSHLASFLILIMRLVQKKNAKGISLKTQELYLLVFVTRYLDLFTNFYSLYNEVMKLFYIAASGAIVYAMRARQPWKTTYEMDTLPNDTFQHLKFAIAPCAVLALFINEGKLADGLFSYLFEACWAFSIFLESIAILPQLILLHRTKVGENITGWYLITLGAYRGLYILNWVYRYMHEPHYSAWIAWVAGALQTALYADFFKVFLENRLGKGPKGDYFVLPT